MHLYNLIELNTFNVFPEYFLGISALYIIIVVVLLTYNIFGLIVQKSISDCIGLVLLLSCYLIVNDDLLFRFSDYGLFPVLGFYQAVISDFFGFFAKLLICFFSSVYFFVIANFLKDYKLTSFEYLLILLFAVIGLLLLCTSNDLLTSYLAIELVSLSSYLLASFKKNSSYSVEAGIKYLIIGSISSAFFLLGSSLVYACIGTINISDFWSVFLDLKSWLPHSLKREFWQKMYSESYLNDIPSEEYLANEFFRTHMCWDAYSYLDYVRKLLNLRNYVKFVGFPEITEYAQFGEPLLEIGLTFIIFSLFIKLALAPFHIWSLDVYEGSPTISTFFFAVITKISVVILLTRICYSMIHFKESWQFYSMVVGLISIFVGSLGGLRQKKLKTLLAYSSISHMGYVILAVSSANPFGVETLLFYMIIYMISGIAIWFIVLAVRENRVNYLNKFNKELGDFVLLKESNPALAFCFSAAAFSLAGIPPLVGFFAKLGILLSIIYEEFYLIALLSILCSIVSTFYYIRIIKILYFENLLVGKLYYPVQTDKIFFLSVSVFFLIFLFINPTFLYIIIHNVVWYSFPYSIHFDTKFL